MDRANAIRLLQALIAAGKDSGAPMAKAWIKKKAWEIGLEGQELISALAYAGNEGWLADGPREGWMSLTSKGAAQSGEHPAEAVTLGGRLGPIDIGPFFIFPVFHSAIVARRVI